MRALWSAAVSRSPKASSACVFEVGGERFVAPGFAHQRLRAGAVALRQQRARQREAALGGQRLVLGEERAHRRGSARSFHSIASARRRSKPMLGQLGLAAMKAA